MLVNRKAINMCTAGEPVSPEGAKLLVSTYGRDWCFLPGDISYVVWHKEALLFRWYYKYCCGISFKLGVVLLCTMAVPRDHILRELLCFRCFCRCSSAALLALLGVMFVLCSVSRCGWSKSVLGQEDATVHASCTRNKLFFSAFMRGTHPHPMYVRGARSVRELSCLAKSSVFDFCLNADFPNKNSCFNATDCISKTHHLCFARCSLRALFSLCLVICLCPMA